MDSFQFKKVGVLSPTVQILLICGLFVVTTLQANTSYSQTGAVFGLPLSFSILFAPIFEEMIFRGWILGELRKRHSAVKAIIFSSALFGLWHLKNIFYFDWEDCVYQMTYAGLAIGPVLAYIAFKTKTIWPGVILHYLNNLASLALVMVNVDWRNIF